MNISLNGEWNLNKKGDAQSYKTLIPSCNYETLIKERVIEDPFVKDNEFKSSFVAKEDFIYKKVVSFSQELIDQDRVYLCFDQIDTIATLFINGQQVCFFNDCHINYKIDIKDKIKVGENTIEVVFNSPVNYVENARNEVKTPINSNGQNGICHIRKPQCHFGWDWGPVLPVSGITGNVYIKTYNVAEITDFNVLQEHLSGKVSLNISSKIDIYHKEKLNCLIKVLYPDGNYYQEEKEITEGKIHSKISIDNPMLWWTKELSNKEVQPLYTISIIVLQNGKEVDSKSLRLGLRTIELDRQNDQYGKNFCFVLNGVRIFAKGANYIPPDSFISRFKESDYDKLLDAVQFSNMNMIRIWGGGYIGSDILYDKCDERGILIWQDFPYACMGYPFFIDEFKTLCIKESENIIRRIRHHASLVLLCGNNEIEQMSGLWLTMKNYISSSKEFYYSDLKNLCYELAPNTAYIEGTPCGDDYLKNVNSDKISDTHIWAVWHGMKNLKYYRKRDTRFCSEFGFESFPNINTIKKFNADEEIDFSSPYIQSHQKCNTGNEKIKYYIADRFNLPNSFKEYIYLSQVCQSECIRYGAEYWRQNKGKCNGSLFWQLNDCWPTSSWAAIDYYNNYKALVYGARKFYNPILVSLLDSKKEISLYVTNDLLSNQNAQIEFKVVNLSGQNVYSENIDIILKANSSNKISSIEMSKLKKIDKSLSLIAYASLKINDKEISSTCLLLNKEKNIKFINPEIKKEVKIENNEIIVTLKNKAYAHFVYIENDVNNENFSDNYFSMMPNSTVVVKQKLVDNCYIDDIDNHINVCSVYDLSKRKSTISNLVRLSVLLKPKNFVNYLFNR